MDLPDLLEISRANAFVTGVQRRCIEEEFTRLQGKLVFTPSARHPRMSKEDVRKARALCSSILDAPIRRLPPELHSYIFAFASPRGSLGIKLDSERRRYRPDIPNVHLLIRVCKYWRDIALQTPSLWRHFVSLEDSYSLSDEQWTGLTKLYGRNLTHVEILQNPKLAPNLKPSRFVNDLLKFKGQFIALKIHRTDPEFTKLFSNGLPMTNLKKLTISLDLSKEPWVRDGIPKRSFPVALPNLEHLHLNDVRLASSESPPNLGVQWLQLTRLTFTMKARNLEYALMLDVLRQPLNLVHLRLINLTTGLTPRTLPDQPIVMPRLRILEITDIDYDLVSCHHYQPDNPPTNSHFLSILSAPSLTSFELVIQPLFEGDFRYRRIAETHKNVATFLRQAPGLAKVRVVHAASDQLLERRYTGKQGYLVLDVSGRAEDFSNLPSTTDSDEDMEIAFRRLKSTFKQCRCLHITLPLRSSSTAQHFFDYSFKSGDAFLHPPKGSFKPRPTSLPQVVYEELVTVSRDFLKPCEGVADGDREARILWPLMNDVEDSDSEDYDSENSYSEYDSYSDLEDKVDSDLGYGYF